MFRTKRLGSADDQVRCVFGRFLCRRHLRDNLALPLSSSPSSNLVHTGGAYCPREDLVSLPRAMRLLRIRKAFAVLAWSDSKSVQLGEAISSDAEENKWDQIVSECWLLKKISQQGRREVAIKTWSLFPPHSSTVCRRFVDSRSKISGQVCSRMPWEQPAGGAANWVKFSCCGWCRSIARPQRGPYTGRGARTSDDRRQAPQHTCAL